MAGLHHVTAMAGDAAANLAFYRDTLGLRLIKKTVNFDDPGTYHLYFGDAAGQPGTILTFFPHAHAARGRRGTGEVSETAFAVPSASFGWWQERLKALGVSHEAPELRFGQQVLRFSDHDGTGLALVADPHASGMPGRAGVDVPAAHAIRGIHGVTISVIEPTASAAVLTDVLGFKAAGEAGGRLRFAAPDMAIGAIVDLQVEPQLQAARMGAGSVHHVAFRAADDAAQAQMADRLRSDHRIGVTEQKDRNYFRSVYFREPAGVIFEIATDAPGFAIDEAPEQLGQTLMLPEWLESRRAGIEAALPTLEVAQG